MKKSINTLIIFFLLLLTFHAIESQTLTNNVTIYQDGKEFEVKGDTLPITLKNKKFFIRFYVEKENSTAFLAFIADKKAFELTGNRKEEERHCFSGGYSYARVRPGNTYETYYINDVTLGFKGYHFLFDYVLSDLPSKDKTLLRKELVITNIEEVPMEDFFLENLYLVLYPNIHSPKIDKTLITKIALHFPDFKPLTTYPEDHFDLKNLNFETFNAASFYKEAIAEGRISRDSLTASGSQYSINKDKEKDKEPIIRYTKNLKFGNTITYDQLTFPSMRVLTTSKGELMAIYVEDYRNAIPALHYFSAYLNETSKKGRDLNYTSEWRDDAKIIQLTLGKVEGFEEEKLSENSRVIIKILMANPKYEEQLQKIVTRYFSIE